VEQRVEALIGFDPDIATDSAVAARWAAAWNEFLAAKRRNAVSAVARLNLDLCPIDEHCLILQCGRGIVVDGLHGRAKKTKASF
jgi:hypothetical protein